MSTAGIAKTWEWVSRGGGRVDRLTLWLGAVADQNFKRRFVRIPYNPKNKPTVIQAEKPLYAGENIPQSQEDCPGKEISQYHRFSSSGVWTSPRVAGVLFG